MEHRFPIIVISARGQEHDKVDALDAGADDYVSKPFGTRELLARMRVALRHAALRDGAESAVYETGKLRVDLAARLVYLDGQEVHLTPNEYKLLAALVRHAGKVLTHRYLLKEVWGPNFVEHTNYLRVHMSQLRRKIEAEPARPTLYSDRVRGWLPAARRLARLNSRSIGSLAGWIERPAAGQASVPFTKRYPTPRTVSRWRGREGSFSR